MRATRGLGRTTLLSAWMIAILMISLTAAASHSSAANVGEATSTLVLAAKKEGTVTIYAAGHTLSQVQLLAKSFQKKYGISVNFVRKSTGQVATMIQSEISAGNVLADVVSTNNQDLMNVWQKNKVITQHKVPNAASILQAQQPEVGAAYTPFDWLALGIAYNVDTIKDGSIPRTWRQFLNEAHGRAIVVANPQSSGVVPTFMTAIDKHVSNQFYKELAGSGAKFYKTANSLEPIQLLATGEADFAIPGVETAIFQAERAKEPVGMIYPNKNVPIITGWIAVMVHAPHPNAARLLVNYQLSKSFQELQLKTGSRSVLEGVSNPQGLPSLRSDQIVRVSNSVVAANKKSAVAEFNSLHD